MTRSGRVLKDLGPGAKRRLPDAKNAWRKMSPGQRGELLRWIAEQEGTGDCTYAAPDNPDALYYVSRLERGGIDS